MDSDREMVEILLKLLEIKNKISFLKIIVAEATEALDAGEG